MKIEIKTKFNFGQRVTAIKYPNCGIGTVEYLRVQEGDGNLTVLYYIQFYGIEARMSTFFLEDQLEAA